MNRNLLKMVALFGILMLATLFVAAEIPKQVNYQGRLTDSNGNFVADGDYPMEFIIYNAQENGELEWSEIHSSVSVKNGLFSVRLGTIDPIENPLEIDDFYDDINGGNRWLEIKVEIDAVWNTLLPRTKFTSVPYAYKSQSGGGWIDDGADVRLQATADSVGIGTSDPHSKLHIVSTGAAHQLRLESTGSGGGYWSIGQSDDGFSSGGWCWDWDY